MRKVLSVLTLAALVAAGCANGDSKTTSEPAMVVKITMLDNKYEPSQVTVTLRVEGEEHLWAERPAVFIFNHQSALDAILMLKLVRRDLTGVGKIELRRSRTVLVDEPPLQRHQPHSNRKRIFRNDLGVQSPFDVEIRLAENQFGRGRDPSRRVLRPVVEADDRRAKPASHALRRGRPSRAGPLEVRA